MSDVYEISRDEVANILSLDKELIGHMIIISRTNTGKTFLLERLISSWVEEGKVDELYIMSDSILYNDDYRKVLVPTMIKKKKMYYLNKWDAGAFTSVIERAKKFPKDKRPKAIFVLDDIVPSMSHKDLEIVSKNITTCRHYNIFLIISSQKANGTITPTIRNNVRYVLFSKVNEDQMKVLSECCNLEKDILKKFVKELGDYEFGFFENGAKGDTELLAIKAN